MKNLLLLLLLVLPGLLLAQGSAPSAPQGSAEETWPVLPALPAKDGAIYYEETVEFKPSVPKDSLFRAARKWVLDYYKIDDSALQVDEREAGQLINRGDHHYQFYIRQNQHEDPYVIELQHTLHIEVKDGQYRFRIYDFTARDEIRDVMILTELDPHQSQVPEPRVRRSARGKKKREETFRGASYRSGVLTGLEKEVKDLIQSLKNAMAIAASSN